MSRLTLVDSAMSNLMAVLVADNAAMVNLTCAELLLKMAQDLGNSNISGDTVPMIHGSVLLLQKEYPILDAFCLSPVKKKTRLQLYGFHKFGDQRPGSASSFLALSDGELIAWAARCRQRQRGEGDPSDPGTRRHWQCGSGSP